MIIGTYILNINTINNRTFSKTRVFNRMVNKLIKK